MSYVSCTDPSLLLYSAIWVHVYFISTVRLIFWDNEVNTMAADALAPCVARTSATIALIMLDKQVLVFHKEGSHLPVPSQC